MADFRSRNAANRAGTRDPPPQIVAETSFETGQIPVVSDTEITRAAKKRAIEEIEAKRGIGSEYLLPSGHYPAEGSRSFIESVHSYADGKLLLVTAINPTLAGEGQANTTAGLGDGLITTGMKAAICIRAGFLRRCFPEMNDRVLRQINATLGGVANGFPREPGLDISVASEAMAIY